MWTRVGTELVGIERFQIADSRFQIETPRRGRLKICNLKSAIALRRPVAPTPSPPPDGFPPTTSATTISHGALAPIPAAPPPQTSPATTGFRNWPPTPEA